MKILYFLVCILFLNLVACAYNEDDLEWACGNSKELHLGETISNGNYTVEAYNFPRNSKGRNMIIGIKLYENNILVAEELLKRGDDYIHDDEVRITALELSLADLDWTTDSPEEAWARIKIERRGLPRFDARFEVNKDDYPAYTSHIELDLAIRNTGDARAEDVDIRIDAAGLEPVTGKIRYHYSEIERGERIDAKTDTAAADPITLRFRLPPITEDRVFNPRVDIEYYDIKGIKYYHTESYPIEVSGIFEISKSINQNIYMNEIATVTVSLRNAGSRPIGPIEVSDSVPANFELIDNSTLVWKLDLKVGECQSFTYSVKPVQPCREGYVLPAATARWTLDGRTHTARSNSPPIAVYGPKICLSKSVSSDIIDVGGVATITVRAENTGNRLASVNVTDYLPEGAALVNGVLNAKKVLKEGEELVFGYAMQINRSGSIELPPATAHFVDTHDYEGTVLSDNISIAVNQNIRPSASAADVSIEMYGNDGAELRTTELHLSPLFALAGILLAFAVMRFRRV